MHTWPIQDVKARFGDFLDACLAQGPQVVTRQGVEAAVLVPVQEWQRLQAAHRPTLKQLLLLEQAREELPIAPRGQVQHRQREPLE